MRNPEVAPILLIIFNRPQTALYIFESIRKVKPRKLFIAADGPRSYKAGEESLCNEARAVINKVDWDCDVKSLLQSENLGCKLGPVTAIDWFFSHVDEGIILEDDCLPDSSFFTFCTELLTTYRDLDQVMHISGTSFRTSLLTNNSYYFSGFTHNWGWATWKRAWEHYDVDMKSFKNIIEKRPMPYFNKHILLFIKLIKAGYLDAWDVQWLVAVRNANGLSIVPSVSLVENIGFNFLATHTVRKPAWMDEIIYGSIQEVIHPLTIQIDHIADEHDADRLFKRPWYIHSLQELLWPIKFHTEKFLTFLTRARRSV